MAKIFEVDFRSGSLVNKTTGTTPINAISPVFNRTEKGLSLLCDGTSTVLRYPEYLAALIGTSDFSLETVVNFSKLTGDQYIMFCGSAGTGSGIYLVLSAFNYFAQIGITNTLSATSVINIFPIDDIEKNTWYHIIVTADRNGSLSAYLNSVLKSSNSIANSDGSLIGYPTSIGSAYGYTNPYVGGNILLFRAYNHLFTETERNRSYDEFLHSYPMVPEKFPQQGIINKPMDLSKEVADTLSQNSFVNDGRFDNPGAYWTGVSGWSFINGKAYGNNAVNLVGSSPITFTLNKKYHIEYDLSDYSAGDLFMGVGTNPWSLYLAGVMQNGHQSFDVYASATEALILIQGQGGFIGTIDNVVIREYVGLVAAYNFIPNGSTLVDISGNGYNGTIYGGLMSNKNGIQFKNGFNDYISIPAIGLLIWTINLRCTKQKTGLSSYNGLLNGTNVLYYALGLTNSDALYYIDGVYNSYDLLYMVNGTYDISIVCNGVNITTYCNGVYASTVTPTSGVILYIENIGFRYLGISRSFPGEFHDLRIYNRALSSQEVRDYHNSFVNPTFIENFSSEGADGIAKVPSGWKLEAGSFKIGEISGLGKNMVPQASSTFDTDGTAFYNPVRGYLTWDGTNKNMIYTSDDATGENRVYVTGFFTLGKYYRVEFDAKSDYSISYGPTIYFEDSSEPIETHTLSPTFQHFIFQGRMSTFDYLYLVFGAYIGVGNTVVIDNIVITEITKLDTVKNETKYLECITQESKITIPSTQTYGTWEFDFMKTSTYAHALVDFISQYEKPDYYTPSQGYALMFAYNGDYFGFAIRNNSYPLSFSGESKKNTWYRYRVTRNISGVFKVYMKGGNQGYKNWTYVGTVTDTYYSSKYFTMTLFTGDRIANIKMLDGIIPFYGDNLVINGEFSSATAWTTSYSGLTISGGVATNDGTNTETCYLQQTPNPFVVGRTYRVTFEASNITGYVQQRIGAGLAFTVVNGLNDNIGICTSNTEFFFVFFAGTTGIIDNVSARELFQ